MKTCFAILAVAAAAIASASAADISVIGANANTNPMMRSADDTQRATTMVTGATDTDATRAAFDVKIAAKDILNKPTALINKNTLAMDNNVFISRSNIAFSQNDRLAMAKKVEAMVTSASDTSDMTTAVLSKNILKAVSGSDSDAAMMTKASAVVAAKDEPSVRGQRIADLVNTVFDMKTKTDTEQSIQSHAPRGVIVLIGTKDILRQPTAVVNKNVAVSDNQIAISRSNLASSQNDAVTLAGSAKVADAVMPASAIRSTESENESAGEMDTNYRVGFLYNKEAGAVADSGDKKTTDKEQFGLWGGGLGFGWRYPLGYWNLYGAGLYGGGCGLGMPFGSFFYC